MPWFIPFILILALAWLVVGILIARWLKQAGHTKPFKGKQWTSRDIYGGGAGGGRTGYQGLGSAVEDGDYGGRWEGGMERRPIVMGGYGRGGVKGL